MNPRTIHSLMASFPAVDAHARSWVNVLERDGTLRTEALGHLLDTYIAATTVLVWVNRKCGAMLPKNQAITFIAEHVGQGEIKVADREFQGFVVVAMNGAATGWTHQ
ncbi:hypothetical protein [Massilia suwonensis]|uniref:Uncharacterized protein n=1 Tax=Massilia suwonensis TaxID=648895 RepID=A0ABW0MR50_9BURK